MTRTNFRHSTNQSLPWIAIELSDIDVKNLFYVIVMFESLETKGLELLTGFIYVWAEIIVPSLYIFILLSSLTREFHI